jgi:hypothetical protein
LYDLSGSSSVLEKPLTTPTNRFTRSNRFICITRFTYSFLKLSSVAIRNTSGLFILGLIVLWPNRRKSDNSLVDRGSANKDVDKLYIVSAVENKPGNNKELFNTKIFKDEALDLELTNR